MDENEIAETLINALVSEEALIDFANGFKYITIVDQTVGLPETQYKIYDGINTKNKQWFTKHELQKHVVGLLNKVVDENTDIALKQFGLFMLKKFAY